MFAFQSKLSKMNNSFVPIAAMSTLKSWRCHFFLNHSHLHITISIHKNASHALPFSQQHTDINCNLYMMFSCMSRPFQVSLKWYCFNGLISCVRVDSQWEISALGGAAITWSPPFIKYLPAHSQDCTLFRIAPMITFPAFTVQCVTHEQQFIGYWAFVLRPGSMFYFSNASSLSQKDFSLIMYLSQRKSHAPFSLLHYQGLMFETHPCLSLLHLSMLLWVWLI